MNPLYDFNNMETPVLCGKDTYQILDKIGEGKFGQVFRGEVVKGRRKGAAVAIKFDFVDETWDADQERMVAPPSGITHESKILHYLNRMGGVDEGIPIGILYWYGVVRSAEGATEAEAGASVDVPCTRMTTMVTTFFDMTLTQWFERELAAGALSTKSTKSTKTKTPTNILVNIRSQIFAALHHIHGLYVIHRDIKPSNFMVDMATGRVYLIDFGMATFYTDGNTEDEASVPPPTPEKAKGGTLVGSPNFASVFVHQGWKNQRRDDFISALYVILYYRMGLHVPWEGLPASPARDHPANQERLRRKLEAATQIPELADCYRLAYHETISPEIL